MTKSGAEEERRRVEAHLNEVTLDAETWAEQGGARLGEYTLRPRFLVREDLYERAASVQKEPLDLADTLRFPMGA